MCGLLALRKRARTLLGPGAGGQRRRLSEILEGVHFADSDVAEGYMDEVFQLGEVVALREAAGGTRGPVVDVSDDGRTVQVRWELRHGHEHAVTTEGHAALRRVHESEEGMAAT